MDNLNFIQESLSSINNSYPILGEYVVQKSIDFVVAQVTKKTDNKIIIEEADFGEHFIKEFKSIDILKQYINGILNWADSENIIKSLNPRFNSEYYVYQTVKSLDSSNHHKQQNLEDILVGGQNYFVKGGPGTGKSTLIKHLINSSHLDTNFIKKINISLFY